MSNRPLKNGRDSESIPSFILELANTKNYGATWTAPATVRIDLEPEDAYALFLPTPGVNFSVSPGAPLSVPAAAVDGQPMPTYNGVLNPAVINLRTSGYKINNEIHIHADAPQSLNVVIFGD